MAASGEAVVLDGLATRVQRPRGWANQKVPYDAKPSHTAQGLAISTIHGDLLWCDGGWPGSCHEHELIELSGLGEVLDAAGVASLVDRGFRGLAKAREHWHAPVGTAAPGIDSPTSSGSSTACRLGCGPCGAVDRPSGRRMGATSLAWAAVPSPGRLPGRRAR